MQLSYLEGRSQTSISSSALNKIGITDECKVDSKQMGVGVEGKTRLVFLFAFFFFFLKPVAVTA